MKKSSKIDLKYIIIALAILLVGAALTHFTRHVEDNPYKDDQIEAASRMFEAEAYMKAEILSLGIPIEAEDLNQTGLLGPEFTELTSTPGDVDAKRTSLSPDFAALMVRYYNQAGMKAGDTIAIGSSGSFPGLLIASLIAADVMDLNVRLICSLGASMHGATRPDYNIFDILHALENGGFAEFSVLAVSPGGNNDQGGGVLEGVLYTGTDELSKSLCHESGFTVLDFDDMAENIRYRLSLYGEGVDLFVNVGGASPNCGTSSYTLNFPQGLVLEPPTIPTTDDRGLNYEFAALGVPVINMLNVRKLATDNGMVYDPVPFSDVGESGVYTDIEYRTWVPAVFLIISVSVLVYGVVRKRNEEKKSI